MNTKPQLQAEVRVPGSDKNGYEVMAVISGFATREEAITFGQDMMAQFDADIVIREPRNGERTVG